MENLFDPVGTPAEQFLLMMHERIVALEVEHDAFKMRIKHHEEMILKLTDSDAVGESSSGSVWLEGIEVDGNKKNQGHT